MILTLTPNPAIDVTYEVQTLRPGSEHRVSGIHRQAGGKGVNVSRVLCAAGVETLILTTAGGATGEALVADLQANGLPHEVVPVAAPTRHTVVISPLDHVTESTLFSEPGGTARTDAFRVLDAMTSHLEAASVLVCSGSLPVDWGPGFYASCVARAREHGVPVIVDASGAALDLAVRAGADVVKPNLTELEGLGLAADPTQAARQLQRMSGGVVVVSRGPEGLLAVLKDEMYAATLDETLSGNATGAGDSVVAALASGMATGLAWPEILRIALLWGAGTVGTATAGAIASEAVESLVGSASVRRIC